MKYSIGDKVILKRTREEGSIVAEINEEMYEVEVDGLSFPVYAEDIDHPYLYWFLEQKLVQKRSLNEEQIPTEKIATRATRRPQGIYLSFLPVYNENTTEDIVSHLKIYLINELEEPVNFLYTAVAATGVRIFSHSATIHSFANIHLHNLSLEEMNDQPRFQWRAEAINMKGALPLDGVLRIKPSRLFEQIMRLQEAGEASFQYLLTPALDKPELPVKVNPKLLKPIARQANGKPKNAEEKRPPLPPAPRCFRPAHRRPHAPRRQHEH